MEIQYAGAITAAEHRTAYYLHYAQAFRPLKWVCGVLLIALVIGNIVLLLQGSREARSIFQQTYLFSIVLLGLLTFPWWFPYTQVRAARQRGGIYQAEVSGTIDDEQVTVNGPAIQATFQWSGFIFYRMTDGVVLLYVRRNSFMIFTRSLFASQADWEAFASSVQQKLPS
jgi:hypothetical protein